MFDIQDPYAAFCFDEAIAMIGNHITNELDRITGNNAAQIDSRRKVALARLLGNRPQYRNPTPTK